jgi:hypothetical protein
MINNSKREMDNEMQMERYNIYDKGANLNQHADNEKINNFMITNE